MASWDSNAVTNEHLLPYVDAATAPPEVQAAMKTLPFERNIVKLLANCTVSFPTLMKLLSSLWSPDRKIRSSDWQLAVLRTAAVMDAPYEWQANEPVARIFGLTDDQLDAIRKTVTATSLLPESLFSPRQQLIARLVDELCLNNRASVETMESLKTVFSSEEIMELLYVHGIYAFLARVMNSCRIDADPPIPGLEESLRKFNAAAIEKERKLAEEESG